MPQIINTNIASLTAQRNLNGSQSSLATSLQRLSTGLRINSAKDDAAGLAISERFTTQIRGLNQAIRNANDGVSFAQTAEGALSTAGDALQRIRELAVQSINDTNSSADRQALNNEVSQLIAEVNRIANSTQFNGQNILDGSLSTLTFQVGANQGQTIQVDGVDSRTSQLGESAFTGTSINGAAIALAVADDDLAINGAVVDLTPSGTGVTTGAQVVDAINLVAADSGVTARQTSSVSVDTGAYTAPAVTADTISINGVSISLGIGLSIADAVIAINDVSDQTGVTARAPGANIFLENTTGADILVRDDATGDALGAIGTTTEVWEAGIVLSTDIGTSISTVGAATADLGLGAAGTLTLTDNVLSDVDVITGANATNALAAIDASLDQVNGLRAELGAVQIRFESTISNLSVTSENLSAARSRIRDADFAAETAELTRSQILQQAGIAILSQANALPQNVLALLQ